MDERIVWSIVSFALGIALSTISNIAIFRSTIAVLTVRLDNIQRELEKIDREFETFEREVKEERKEMHKYIADVMLKAGVNKRWSDQNIEPPPMREP